MVFGSVCSGIEAASVAWHPLGWRAAFVSDIEPFPSAALAHHYPDVPNHGDMTKFKEWPDHAIDLLVGGTPCQSFSVAGLRKGLADPRGNLMLTYLAIANRYRPRWLVWENVPGVLSSWSGPQPPSDLEEGQEWEATETSDFGCFLAGLGELGYGFAYCVRDAQYFGVPQRRRRVFVVGYLGDWRRAAAVLFERHSLQGNPPPRRETGQGVAGTLDARANAGGFPGTDGATSGHDVAAGQCFGGNNTSGPIDVATALNAHGGPAGRQDFESETFVASVAPTIGASHAGFSRAGNDRTETETLVTHSLRAEGYDASEDGTGRGTPLVPAFYSITPSNSNKDYTARLTDKAQAVTAGGNRPSARGGDLIAHCFDARQSDVIQYGDRTGPLDTDGYTHALAFSCKDHGADAGDISPSLGAMGHHGSHANAGGQVAVAFPINQDALRGEGTARTPSADADGRVRLRDPGLGIGNEGDPAGTVTSAAVGAVAFQTRIARNGRGQPSEVVPALNGADAGETSDMRPCVATASAVRRLTPMECERLQGFPDGYTAIPYRGKPAADGPRYKALGNSMAVPVMRWIGERIQAVEDIAP